MSGTYHGVQAIIKARNSYAEYIPCFAHSLNLAGNEAENSNPQVSSFFDIIQKLYTFMSASTHRWSVVKLDSIPVLKSLSETRWSAIAGSAKALQLGYCEIKNALENIRDDACERADTKHEADGLVKKLNQLDFGILTELWLTIMDRFNYTSTMLQATDLDLNTAVSLMQSLTDYISSLKSEFELFEQ